MIRLAGAKVIRCDPAGSTALAVVHTILNSEYVREQSPEFDNVANPEDAIKTPSANWLFSLK